MKVRQDLKVEVIKATPTTKVGFKAANGTSEAEEIQVCKDSNSKSMLQVQYLFLNS